MTTLDPSDVDGTPVLCTECGTAVEKPTDDEAEQTASNHNDKRHDGEPVAEAVTSTVDIGRSEVPVGRRDTFIRQVMNLVR